MSDWTDAKRTRKPLQSKLISGSYYNVTRPRPQTSTGTRGILADKCLMDFGFAKSSAVDKLKRKHASALQSNTIMDSQADSDDESLLPGTCDLTVPSTGRRSNKRRRSINLFIPDDSISSDPPSSPLPQSSRPGLTTPTMHRTRKELNEFDVPSSLSYERYNYRHWDVCDTPTRITKFRIYTELSPPRSSLCDERLPSSPSPRRLGAVDVLTPLPRSRGMLTPPHSRYAPRPPLHSSPFELQNDARLPLADMIPTLIPTPQTRNRANLTRTNSSQDHNGNRHHGPSISRATSMESRPDTPSVWHDASESFDPPAADETTIEDSQDREMFDTLSPHSNGFTQQRLDTSDTHFSWGGGQGDSLMETLLPPDYRSSQYDLHPSSSSSDAFASQTCRAPLLCGSSPSPTARKRTSDDARPYAPEKRQKNA